MDRFNDMINNRRDRFDTEQPDGGHLERFLMKLDAQHARDADDLKKLKRLRQLNRWYASAAAVIVALCITTVALMQFSDTASAEQLVDGSVQIRQLEQYYVTLAEEKIVSIDSMTLENKITPSAAEDAKGRIQVLLDLSRSLAEEYLRLNQDERVLNAIVQHYMMISSVFELVQSQSKANHSNLTKSESNEKN